MKKIFSILAVAAIALSFASCGEGNSVEMNGFKITVDSITATGAFVSVVPADTTVAYYYGLWEAEELKGQTADSITALLTEYYGKYSIDLLVQYGILKQGAYEASYEGYLTPNTDYAAFAVALEQDSTGTFIAPKGWAVKYFRTPAIAPKETVALKDLVGTFDYENELLQLYASNDSIAFLITVNAKNPNGSFTEKNFYDDGYYIMNYVEWGDGANDWAQLAGLSINGSFNADQSVYTFSGSIIGANAVKYTFDKVETIQYVEDEGGEEAPARKVAAKKALKKFPAIK